MSDQCNATRIIDHFTGSHEICIRIIHLLQLSIRELRETRHDKTIDVERGFNIAGAPLHVD